MKAKLGNTEIDYWQISLTQPSKETWVLEAFQKKQLSWSGQFALTLKEKQQLQKQGMGKTGPAQQGEFAQEVESLGWTGLYISPNKMGNAYPESILLIVNQFRIPAFGHLGEYLVRTSTGALEVYSEKKFKCDLTKISK